MIQEGHRNPGFRSSIWAESQNISAVRVLDWRSSIGVVGKPGEEEQAGFQCAKEYKNRKSSQRPGNGVLCRPREVWYSPPFQISNPGAISTMVWTFLLWLRWINVSNSFPIKQSQSFLPLVMASVRVGLSFRKTMLQTSSWASCIFGIVTNQSYWNFFFIHIEEGGKMNCNENRMNETDAK